MAEETQLKKLINDGNYTNIPSVGDIIKGKVLAANKKEVRLDIDGYTIGVIRGRELYNESEEYRDIKAGDEVEATVVEIENENGEMELSFRYAGQQKIWGNLNKYLRSGEIIKVKVQEVNKGGLMTKYGHVIGFIPVSQLSPEYYPRVQGGDKNKILDKLRTYQGTEMEVKIIDVNEKDEKLILSQKAAWEDTKSSVISQFKPGDIVEGKITAITDFGVFVEFGEQLEGLIHISELAWQRIDDPRTFVKIGDEVKAQIINIDGSKIFLSMKKLVEDPWKQVAEKYKLGQTVKGKVLKVNPFGLFVELDRDIHGLAHISELSDKPVKNIRDIAEPGVDMDFKIISIEPNDHRLGLSLKGLNSKTEEKEKSKKTPEETKSETPTSKAKKTKKEKKTAATEKTETKTDEEKSSTAEVLDKPVEEKPTEEAKTEN